MLLSSTEKGIYLSDESNSTIEISDSGICKVSELPTSSSATQKIHGVLGVIRLKVGKYVISINSAVPVGKIVSKSGDNGDYIFHITSTSILPVQTYSQYDADEAKYLDLLRAQLNSSKFYYCRNYDLTNSAQRNLSGEPQNLDTRFFWNEFLTKELEKFNGFVTPVICGYAKFVRTSFRGTADKSSEIVFGLITRRSKFRAGTRYFRRGIDSKGNVANYNETEQFLLLNDGQTSILNSYLQTRGSVPVFWSEINNLKYKPMLKIGQESSIEPATLHFDEQISKYGKNYLINLVNQKGYELPVKNAYEKIIKDLAKDGLNYIYFDFHHECRKMQWHRVYLLIDHLKELGFSGEDYFKYDLIQKKSIHLQEHVVRTNCMDCLDRTNVVQSTLGRFFLQNQFAHILQSKVTKWEDSNEELNSIFQNIWADNADAVSSVYSGTGALKTDFTRTGKRTKQGAFNDLMNSITRYLKNNYQDGSRQDSFDLILGEFQPSINQLLPFEDKRLIQYQYALTFLKVFLTFLILAFFKQLFYGFQKKQQLLLIICLSGVVSCLAFMFSNGLQIVDWPKLKPLHYLKQEPVYENGKLIGEKFVVNKEF